MYAPKALVSEKQNQMKKIIFKKSEQSEHCPVEISAIIKIEKEENSGTTSLKETSASGDGCWSVR